MTGFGRAEAIHGGHRFTVEIKSVNGKFCEIKTHCPREYLAWENEMIALVRKSFNRGRFDLFLQIEIADNNKSNLTLNEAAAENYIAQLNQLISKFKLKDSITISHLLTNKEIFTHAEENLDENWEAVKTVLTEAIQKLNKVSRNEGTILANDIEKRLGIIGAHLAKVEKIAPHVVIAAAQKLRQRIEKLLDGKKMDEDRLEQEIAQLADRSEITEETVRLRAHLERVSELLKSDVPKGRELDFIVQEMHRETNTLGQKSQDYGIADLVIQMKTEIEKIREQVQNLE
jgi:uncharacterized protein (TIGR00255 family)